MKHRKQERTETTKIPLSGEEKSWDTGVDELVMNIRSLLQTERGKGSMSGYGERSYGNV